METGADWNHDFRISTTEKETKWVRGMASHERQPDGSIFWDGLLLDITEQKQADERLRQMAKMECVGRLAGGVAHDYNNIIMGILNYAEFCRDCIDADHPIRQWVDEITTEAQRSANLTRQLLAFARKQTITPKVLDLNDAVVGMLRMLQRLIGEDIELVWEPGANVWQVTMDPSQVDQILANLCVNARDAIGGVGRITIETDNVELDADDCANYAETVPGAYVVLTVSDTGCGMDRQTLEHVFEPFFTTKSVGEGTGLGLATVYGITKQSNGHLSVDSEPGQGTTFRIYLPRAAEDSPGMEREPPEATTPGGNETILLVEDEKSIRVTAGMFLRAVGYTVLAAENPEQALRLATEHEGPIHLLITDVVMPDMSGRDLADRLTEDSPDISVIYMSGYTADVIAHRGVLEAGVDFLSKPFTRDVLTLKVREVLDRA
jgi:signal transduction histidine kinase/CheY-like chemotaxis protein